MEVTIIETACRGGSNEARKVAAIMVWTWFVVAILAAIRGDTVEIRIPLNDRREIELDQLIAQIARAERIGIDTKSAGVSLPMTGLGGPLTKRILGETLGIDLGIDVDGTTLVLRVPAGRSGLAARPDWVRRLNGLAERGRNESARRTTRYGMAPLRSYRPNDPARPTVCLIHGLNSTSSVFRHMITPIEEAGYGLVVYDFPYNRALDDSSAAFRRDWVAFRKANGEERPWAIVAHSMGGLLARSYLEDDRDDRGDVVSLILIAPVNGGSFLSRAQTLLQLSQGIKAVNRAPDVRGDALAHLGDGLGVAAEDLTPGSRFLTVLNARGRRARVRYHIVAGDGGFLSPSTRRQIEASVGLTGRPGLLAGLTRLAASKLPEQLDEVGEGTGDGAVSLESTRLAGVEDRVILHANHLELIRAPLLYPDAGPIVSLPSVLGWLRSDLPVSVQNPVKP